MGFVARQAKPIVKKCFGAQCREVSTYVLDLRILEIPDGLSRGQMLPGTAILRILTDFNKILTKFDQIFTNYVKNHQIHVGNVQGRHFLRKKKTAGMPTHRTGVGVGGYWGIGGGYWGKK